MAKFDENELNFKKIVEESIYEIFVVDANSLNFLYVNRGMSQNSQYSQAELQNMNMADLLPRYRLDELKSFFGPLKKQTETTLYLQSMIKRKDSSRYLAEINLQKQIIDNRLILSASVIEVNVSARVNEDLKFAQSLLDSGPDACFVVDATGHIRIVNKLMECLFGYSKKELISMNVDQLVPETRRHQHTKDFANYIANPRLIDLGGDLDLEAVTKSGQSFPIEIRFSPVYRGGHLFIAAALRDVSGRKKIELSLKESEENQRIARKDAEHATHTKSRFLAAASHDLRQPLQALRLYLSAINMRIDDKKTLQLCQKMHLSLDAMGELLESLLDLSSLESGNVKADIQEVKLTNITDRIISGNYPQAIAKGLDFNSQIDDVIVKTDPALLERILENFVTNAVRYTREGSIKFSTQLKMETIHISISDSGIGIPKSDLPTVFDEYYQLNNDVRDRSKGLGLGLSIVKHLSRILDHEISAESNEGEGSCFSIIVPLGTKNNAPLRPNEFTIKLTKAPVKVLIIDDDEQIADAMSEVMRGFDIDVTTTSNGMQALELVETGFRPTLIISDYRMPQLNGLQTVTKLRQQLDENIAVVMMTGDTTIDLIKEASLDNFDVLNKPIHDKKLLQLINLINETSTE